VIDGPFEEDFFRVADAYWKPVESSWMGGESRPPELWPGTKTGRQRTVSLFEPNAKLQASIAKSVELYPSMQAQINPVAVSDKDGTVLFDVNKEQTGASHIVEGDGR
jgi:hypothetical protein